MSDTTLRQLEYFVAVAQTGSILEAAEHTRISPTAVGLGLDQLESSLGVALTIRKKSKGVTLTAEGQKLLADAVHILGSARRLKGHAQELSGETAGRIRLGCVVNLSRWVVPPIIKYFAQKYPALDIELVERDAHRLQSMVRAGDVDLAFVYSNQAGADLAQLKVTDLRLRVLVPADSNWAQQDSIRLADLSQLPAILIDVSPTRQFQEELLKTVGYSGSIRWCSVDTEAVCSFVGHGLGFTLMFGIGRAATDHQANLACRDIADAIPLNGVSLCYPNGVQLQGPVAELAEFARSHLPPLQEPLPRSTSSLSSITVKKGR